MISIGTSEKLRALLGSMFDFTDNHELFGMEFKLYGRYHKRTAKYFASKAVEVYAYSNNEHILYYRLEGCVDEFFLIKLREYMEKNVKGLVKPDEEHMSTVITFIVECDSIEKAAEEMVRSFKFKKSFLLGLHGWADVKLIVLAEGASLAIENQAAKGDAKRLQLLQI